MEIIKKVNENMFLLLENKLINEGYEILTYDEYLETETLYNGKTTITLKLI